MSTNGNSKLEAENQGSKPDRTNSYEQEYHENSWRQCNALYVGTILLLSLSTTWFTEKFSNQSVSFEKYKCLVFFASALIETRQITSVQNNGV